MSEKLAYSIEEASQALGVSERTFRAMVAREQVRIVRLGRRVLVPADALRQLLEKPEKE